MPMRQDGRTAAFILFDTEYRLILFLFPCAIVEALAGRLGSLAVTAFRLAFFQRLASIQTSAGFLVQVDRLSRLMSYSQNQSPNNGGYENERHDQDLACEVLEE
jgi:hypothetical protein